jgi:hypothetical protein
VTQARTIALVSGGMPMSVARAAALIALLAACGTPAAAPPGPVRAAPPAFFTEDPAGSKNWTAVAAEPDWVKSPPPRDGYIRVVGESASDLRDIATTKARPDDALDRRVREPLTPIVGADAAERAAKAASKASKLVARATREEDGPNPMVPGNHFVQAWALWEVSIDDFVADLPADSRNAARAALVAMPAVPADGK